MILLARSKILCYLTLISRLQMFSNSMRESSQSEVRLPFVDPEIFSLFINYFAVGYLSLTVSSLIDVYLQADQWLMPEVRPPTWLYARY